MEPHAHACAMVRDVDATLPSRLRAAHALRKIREEALGEFTRTPENGEAIEGGEGVGDAEAGGEGESLEELQALLALVHDRREELGPLARPPALPSQHRLAP